MGVHLRSLKIELPPHPMGSMWVVERWKLYELNVAEWEVRIMWTVDETIESGVIALHPFRITEEPW